MNHHRFTTWTSLVTHLPSRRDFLRGIAAAGLGLATIRPPGTADARKKRKKNKRKNRQALPPPAAPCTPKCGRKECGDDGCGGSCGGCGADQVCVTGTCCTPQPLEKTCTARCGHGARCPLRCDTVIDPGACSQLVACSCPNGHECLSNGSCGQVCEQASDCPGQVADCGSCGPSAEGTKHCSYYPICPNQPCTTTADCPIGEHCEVTTSCGPGGSSKNFCVPLYHCAG